MAAMDRPSATAHACNAPRAAPGQTRGGIGFRARAACRASDMPAGGGSGGMKRRGAVGVGLIAAAITGGCMVYGYVQQPAATAEYTDWRPTAAAIREEI